MKKQNEEIPSVVEEPVKCLRKWFDYSLKDHGSIKQLEGKVKHGLGKIDKTGLPGKLDCQDLTTWVCYNNVVDRFGH